MFDKDDGVLRFALLDKYVNGGTAASRAAAIADIERIRRLPNIGMALGSSHLRRLDRRLAPARATRIGIHVNWVHTKFMLIDPLGPKPMTLTGSANFSQASIDTNDENMVLIRGDRRVADIYFGEFMRVFAHHRFRESVKRHIDEFGPGAFEHLETAGPVRRLEGVGADAFQARHRARHQAALLLRPRGVTACARNRLRFMLARNDDDHRQLMAGR